MSDKDDVDFEQKNALGTLDRFVTNIALAIVSVFPTFAIGIAQPWRLAPLIVNDVPEGRRGALLSPGAFFVVALTVVLVVAAVVSTEETLAWNGSLIGPDWAVSVASAAAEGNIWKTVSKIAPVFLVAVFWGIIGLGLKKWAGPWWTLRVSIRAAFYFVTILVSYAIFMSAIFDAVTVHLKKPEVSQFVYKVLPLTLILFIFWFYFWVFNSNENISEKRAFALSASLSILLPIILFGSNYLLIIT
jgi:hypothetical protein